MSQSILKLTHTEMSKLLKDAIKKEYGLDMVYIKQYVFRSQPSHSVIAIHVEVSLPNSK